MAFLSHQMTFPMRPSNKEPEWSTAYDDLFNQYIDTDNLGFNESAEPILASVNSSTSSCQSGSSPSHKWNVKDIEQDFWAKTLQSLEESAACLEQSQQISASKSQNEYNFASHSDFLSLGGCPSPHLSSPSSPCEAARRRKASWNSYGQKPRPAPISPSAAGIKKTNSKGDNSPKMMSPSRYRAGFKDVWANKTSDIAQNYTLTLPLRSEPLSPPPSGKSNQTVDAAAFCSPREIGATPFHYFEYAEEERSPTSRSFEHYVDMHTPGASPLTSPGVERGNFYGDMGTDTTQEAFTGRSMYYAVPPTAPQSSELAWQEAEVEKGYEMSPSFNPWTAASTIEHSTQAPAMGAGYASLDPVAPPAAFQRTAADELAQGGLMISCDAAFTTSEFPVHVADTELSALPTNMYSMARHEYEQSRLLSRTRSPTPTRSPRSQRASSRPGNRRTPSTPRSPRGVSKSAFVNFTPSDSAKLLTGVAPSGSSKTKARREKEAADKRRKFSQAAVKAVAEAGGDVKILREVML